MQSENMVITTKKTSDLHDELEGIKQKFLKNNVDQKLQATTNEVNELRELIKSCNQSGQARSDEVQSQLSKLRTGNEAIRQQ